MPSGRPAQPAAVLQYLIRPGASLCAGLAQLQPRRVPCRRPRPVTHVMPGVWVVLIPVAPLPAAVCPGKLRTAEHAGILTSLGERYSERIIRHLPNPLRRCRLCAWPGGPSVESAASAAECGCRPSLRPAGRVAFRPTAYPRSGGYRLGEQATNPPFGRKRQYRTGGWRCQMIRVRARGRARPAGPSGPA